MAHNKNNTPSVKTFHTLSKLKLRVKSASDIEISKAGQLFKARHRGCADFVFGATAEEAKERLLEAQSKGWGFGPSRISHFEK